MRVSSGRPSASAGAFSPPDAQPAGQSPCRGVIPLAPSNSTIYAAVDPDLGPSLLSRSRRVEPEWRFYVERRVVVRRKISCAMVLVSLAACSGKNRPFGEAPISEEGTAAAGVPEPSSSSLQPGKGGDSAVGVAPPAPEGPPPVDVLHPVDTTEGPPSDTDSNVGIDICPGCLVSDDCIALGEVNPDNPCEVCDPTRAATGWSSNDGAACDDGLFCTIDDSCSGRSCSGAPRVCEDGVACNGVSICVEDDGACSAAESQCGALQRLRPGHC